MKFGTHVHSQWHDHDIVVLQADISEWTSVTNWFEIHLHWNWLELFVGIQSIANYASNVSKFEH